MAQWLGLRALTARTQVQSLVGELKSHKPCVAAKKTNKQTNKRKHVYYLIVSLGQESRHSLAGSSPWVSQGCSQGSARAGVSSGGPTGEGPTPKLPQDVVRSHVLMLVGPQGLRPRASCWPSLRGCPQLLEAACSS